LRHSGKKRPGDWLRFGTRHVEDSHEQMAHDATLTEWVAAGLAVTAVLAIIWLALMGDDSARTALTGLVGAASSYFLTPKLRNGNGKSNGTPPG
jgi:hypothetical protein